MILVGSCCGSGSGGGGSSSSSRRSINEVTFKLNHRGEAKVLKS